MGKYGLVKSLSTAVMVVMVALGCRLKESNPTEITGLTLRSEPSTGWVYCLVIKWLVQQPGLNALICNYPSCILELNAMRAGNCVIESIDES